MEKISKKGFASNLKLAKEAGRKGGKKSWRAGVKKGQGKKWDKYRKELKEEGYL